MRYIAYEYIVVLISKEAFNFKQYVLLGKPALCVVTEQTVLR